MWKSGAVKKTSARGLHHFDLFIDPAAAAPPAIPLELSFFPATFELILRAGGPYASVMDCFVIPSSNLVRDSLAEREMGEKL